jgi:hypothetical protein
MISCTLGMERMLRSSLISSMAIDDFYALMENRDTARSPNETMGAAQEVLANLEVDTRETLSKRGMIPEPAIDMFVKVERCLLGAGRRCSGRHGFEDGRD